MTRRRWALTTGVLLAVLVAPSLSSRAGEPPAVAPAECVLEPITPALAAATFERLAAMEGTWTGASTRGWTEEMTNAVIARGSCVMEKSFGAHPDETMLTLYHMDGERLLLTHYCVARNQPRLAATRASADGATVELSFLDATGITSRDDGHMDRLVLTFGDASVTKQWYWYAGGAERPMERITLTRAD